MKRTTTSRYSGLLFILAMPLLASAAFKRVPPPPGLVPQRAQIPVARKVIRREILPMPPVKLDLRPRQDRQPSRLTRRPLPAVVKNQGGAEQDKLQFLNNNLLTGRFLGFKEGQLVWQHPAVKIPIPFEAGSLQRVDIKGYDIPPAARKHTCTIELANGDELQGDLVSMDAGSKDKPGHLVLDTWYAGQLRIPFNALKRITPGVAGSSTIYAGPESMEGWATGTQAAQMTVNMQIQQRVLPMGVRPGGLPGNVPVPANGRLPGDQALAIAGRMPANTVAQRWRFSGGAFYSRGNSAIIARNFELPDKVKVEFDLAWQGYFSMGVNLFADTFANYAGNAYSLRLDSSNAYMYRMINSSSSQMGRVRSGLQSPRTKARISLCVDKEAKSIIMLVDGAKVGSWKETATREFAGKGKGIVFYSRNSQPMRVSNIHISVWDGSMPDGNTDTAGNGKEDFLLFSNNDSISGELLGIKDGKVSLQAEFRKINVPLERIARIDLKQRQADLTGPLSRGLLRNNGRMMMTIKDWKSQGVEVESPIFGTATVNPAIFNAIEFNLDKPRRDPNDGDPFFP